MTTTESTAPKVRTITLTDRPPVRIREDLWPVIASARRHDGKVEAQANRLWHLTVRQHADGRTIVYGSEQPGNGGSWAGYEVARAGEVLAAGDDIPTMIRRVGSAARCSEAMVDECIAELPAEDIDAMPGKRVESPGDDGDFWGAVERIADFGGVAVSREKLATMLALLVRARPHCPEGLQAEIVAAIASGA